MSKTVLFFVNHLMGAGHLARVLNLGHAFVGAGYDVHVLSGGFPVPQFDTSDITMHQMPPVKSKGADFSVLLTLEEEPVDDDYHTARMAFARGVLQDIQPDLFIVELFPFGRRNLKSEYLDQLSSIDVLPHRPKTICSIRDILAPPSKPSKVTFAEDTLTRWFDVICVHSDKDAVPLDTTWPVSDRIEPLLRYTGFVAPALHPPHTSEATGEILVSTGSGAFADNVFHTALDVAAGAFGQNKTWRLLIGRADDARLELFRARAPANVTIEPARSDYRDLIQNAKACVCLCGYNSAMDVLQSGVPAVIIPYDERSETEQAMRAAALEHLPGIEKVRYGALNAASLVDALEKTLAAPQRSPATYDFDGARRTVEICTELLT